MKKVKVCGLTSAEDARYVSEAGADYAGFILFFPKSKRFVELEKARDIMACLDRQIVPVGVMVKPSAEQVRAACNAGFGALQLHGDVSDEIIACSSLPVFKAFNVSDLSDFERYSTNPKVCGYVFDALVPGSGRTFDWDTLRDIPYDGKIRLIAGGLGPDNVAEAITATGADGADTSSGVENDSGKGKNREKVLAFVRNVRALG